MIYTLEVKTHSNTEMTDITASVRDFIKESGVEDGTALIYTPHTTAAITINESADPDVCRDVIMEMNKIVPLNDNYRHGEGNSAAHIKSSLFGCSETVIIEKGKLLLGTWQGVFFCEFDGPRNRKAYVKIT